MSKHSKNNIHLPPHMSKAMWYAHLSGMAVHVLKSLAFNLCIFIVGLAIGSGGTLLHVQKMWKQSYSNQSAFKLESFLRHNSLSDKDVKKIVVHVNETLIELR